MVFFRWWRYQSLCNTNWCGFCNWDRNPSLLQDLKNSIFGLVWCVDKGDLVFVISVAKMGWDEICSLTLENNGLDWNLGLLFVLEIKSGKLRSWWPSWWIQEWLCALLGIMSLLHPVKLYLNGSFGSFFSYIVLPLPLTFGFDLVEGISGNLLIRLPFCFPFRKKIVKICSCFNCFVKCVAIYWGSCLEIW